MANRNTTPAPHPLAELLTVEGSNNAEDSVSLIGYVGVAGPNGELRLFADEEFQRFMDIPADDVIHAEAVPEDEHGRMRIYVKRSLMVQEVFGSDAEDELKNAIIGPRMSVWQFLPENRIIAAGILGLLPGGPHGEYVYEEETTS